jgi:predicted  nucleic acid-binding Zn-ribbon protein
MKTFIIAISLLPLAFSSATAGPGDCCERAKSWGRYCCFERCCPYIGDWSLDNYDIDVDRSTIHLRPRSRGYSKARITGDCRLYVNGDRIDLDREQKELVEEFHDLVFDIRDEARSIAREGAKLGAAGASLGIQALGSVFKLLSPYYDSDDLEREMEAKASKLEARAEKIEERAERIEEMTDKLKLLEKRLERRIPELTKENRS